MTPETPDPYEFWRERFARGMVRNVAPPDFPKIVCLCGSTRFPGAWEAAARRETLAGRIVLSVGMFGHQEGLDMAGPVKAGLDGLHKRKIDLADEVLVLNVGGYVGDSTRSEIAYAKRLGKPVRYLEPPPESPAE